MRGALSVCAGVSVVMLMAGHLYLSDREFAQNGHIYTVGNLPQPLSAVVTTDSKGSNTPTDDVVTKDAADSSNINPKKYQVLRRQQERKATLRKVCSTLKSPRRRKYPAMHVDTSHKVMFCNIAKVGSTVWGRALAMLVSNLTGSELQEKAGQYHVVERNPSSFIHREINTFGVNTTKTWTTTMWQDNKRDYYKIMFVRDPFDRLKSAYRDKFLIHDSRTTSYYTGHVGKLIRTRYRDVKSNNPHLEVTFEEFLRYVLDEYKNGNTMDNHWRRYVDRCDPCGIHYDFIGHIETMAEDAEYLFGEVFHSNLNVTETLNPSHGPSATAHELTHPILHSTYYNGITKSVIRGIRDYLSVDAKLFGFDIYKQLRTKVSKDHNAVTNSRYVYFPMQ